MATQDRLARINGRRFTAADVKRATDIDQNTLTNYLSKTPLELCSEPPGQGRTRQFCLIDVYQIALLYALVGVTKDAIWSARALNFLLFVEQEEEVLGRSTGMLTAEHVAAKAKDQFCMDVRSACPIYSHRDIHKPYFIYATHTDIRFHHYRLNYAQRGDLGFMDSTFFGGVIWNATIYLDRIDLSLQTILLEREDNV